MVNDSDVIGQQGDLRQDVTGDQNGFPCGVAQFPNEVAHLCDADRVEAVDWLVQNQQFRVVHDSQCDGKTLLHAQRILGKQLFVPVRQVDNFQRSLDIFGAFETSQIGKNPKIFRCRQIRIKPRRLNQGADTGQDVFFVAAKRFAENLHIAGRWCGKAQQHPHGGGFPGSVAAQQAVDTPFPHMDGQIGHAVLLSVCFGKATGFDNIIAHVRIPPFRDGLSIPSQP